MDVSGRHHSTGPRQAYNTYTVRHSRGTLYDGQTHAIDDVDAAPARAGLGLDDPGAAVPEVGGEELARLVGQQEGLRYEVEVAHALAALHRLDVLVQPVLARYLVRSASSPRARKERKLFIARAAQGREVHIVLGVGRILLAEACLALSVMGRRLIYLSYVFPREDSACCEWIFFIAVYDFFYLAF